MKTLPKDSRPCCGVYAVALVTGNELETMMELFSNTFEKSPQWKGRTYYNQLLEILWKLKKNIVQHIPPKGIRTKQLESFLKPNTKYIFSVNGHTMAYLNGIYYDQYWNEGKHVKLASANRLVKRIIEIKDDNDD